MPTNADLGEIAQRLTPALLRYFVRRAEQPADASDLLAETLLVLCRRYVDLPDDPHEQLLWSYGVAANVLRQDRRTRRRRSELGERLRRELAHDGDTTEPPDSALAVLEDAMRALAPQDREIVRLIHWEGLSQAEIARVLQVPAATVRSRYLRARTQLKQSIVASRDYIAEPRTVSPR